MNKHLKSITLFLSLGLILVAAPNLSAAETIQKFSDFTLQKGDTLHQKLKVYQGNAFLYGTIKAPVTVYLGDIHIGADAQILDSVEAISGKVFRNGILDERKSYFVQDNVKNFFYDQEDQTIFNVNNIAENFDFFKERKAKNSIFFRHPSIRPSGFSYNKVDGLNLGLTTDFSLLNKNKMTNLSIYLHGGHAFASSEWNHYVEMDFTYSDFFHLGAANYKMSATEDDWKVDKDLNSVAALLIHEDFYNYYQATGNIFFTGVVKRWKSGDESNHDLGIRASIIHDKISSIENQTDYSLFSSNKHFDPNRALNIEGNLKELNLSLFYGLKYEKTARLRTMLNYEKTLQVNQAYSFSKVKAEIYSRFGENLGFINYSRLEDTPNGALVPDFKFSTLGGIGTLPGYSLNSLSGNKMILSKTQLFYGSIHGSHWLTSLNIGDVWNSQKSLLQGFDKVNIQDLKASAGIGYGYNDKFEIMVFKRLDTNHNPYQIQLSAYIEPGKLREILTDLDNQKGKKGKEEIFITPK